MQRLCSFEILGNHYAVEMQFLRQVLDAVPISMVPIAPKEILGVSNILGELVTIVSLDALLGLEQSLEEYDRPLMILLEARSHRFAVPVERIETLTVSPENFEPFDDPQAVIQSAMPNSAPPLYLLNLTGITRHLDLCFSHLFATS